MPRSKLVKPPSAGTIGKEGRARDSALAMQEYQAERIAVLARTERLRALRLAKAAESVPQSRTKLKSAARKRSGAKA